MPIKKAAFKSLRQAQKREQRNKKIKKNIAYYERKFNKAISTADLKGAKEIYQVLQKALDKAGGKGVIKKNATSRRKSRLSRKIRNLQK
ncbi:30S ribosomal protein S20 [bacterium (Candidatus Moisslbacteria) CG12_big_fil_rev_8_21_14_0_65_36_11]|nr:30S ribosomal protein S20 [Candidatus Kuenenbacteria bacterium]OIP76831.1 MAG: hypothetical protein AUK09_00905 [Parcubacteria group bacterium CG2_30_36_38]PIW67747.1 MAG: 30S ribosomal protein S20 [bacterium (Candidatus Moisslbacteria) CG12_big_fil_rev_8_21_14_0_65_36_11]PIZ90310.1 MAG: 30S ribosomal protein S20 [bacterium (Candidatus Moisslbacteria) CG_4_10_14_0_2_um_filter_36_61]PJC00859.1 MAG: 30S ribosomal protein S20 [bacterium (Candidatus Moisslbacteria) CG_4_9_14_0_8_um_filter_36_20]